MELVALLELLGRPRQFIVGLTVALLTGCVAASTDDVDPCVVPADCEPFFGAGSVCESGYCTEPYECAVDEDCQLRFGEDYQCAPDTKACFLQEGGTDPGAQETDGEPPPSEAEDGEVGR